MGRRKGDPGNRNKKPSGTRYFRTENEYASIKCEVNELYPQTLCIELYSAFTIKNKDISNEESLQYIRDMFHQTGSTLFTSCSHILNEKLFPKELHKDIIIITPAAEDNGDYYTKKIRKEKPLLFRCEIYIHTSNNLPGMKDSCEIKFNPTLQHKQSEETNILIDFCNSLINSTVLKNNSEFFSKKFK